MNLMRVAAAGALVAGVGGAAPAQTFPAEDPGALGWARGDANTAYFQWETFSSAGFSLSNGPNAGTIPSPLPAGWADVAAGEFTGAAIVTSGSGNPYTFNADGFFRFDVPNYSEGELAGVVERDPVGLTGGEVGPGDLYTAVLIQVRTLGFRIQDVGNVVTADPGFAAPFTALDPADVAAFWPVSGFGPTIDDPLVLVDGPDEPFAGDVVDEYFYFELPGANAVFSWLCGAPQFTSLDKIAIDTAVFRVPVVVCPGDANGDGAVTPLDISLVLSAFGSTGVSGPGEGDVTGDGAVTPLDISVVLSNFGVSCG